MKTDNLETVDTFFTDVKDFADFVKKDLIDKGSKAHGLKYINREDTHVKRVRFSVAEWDYFPSNFQLNCKNWNQQDNIRQILVFEFRIKEYKGFIKDIPYFLDLVLTISPAVEESRKIVYDAINSKKSLIGLTAHELNPFPQGERQWTQVFHKEFIENIDSYNSQEKVIEEIKNKWDYFLTNSLPCIKEVIKQQLYSR